MSKMRVVSAGSEEANIELFLPEDEGRTGKVRLLRLAAPEHATLGELRAVIPTLLDDPSLHAWHQCGDFSNAGVFVLIMDFDQPAMHEDEICKRLFFDDRSDDLPCRLARWTSPVSYHIWFSGHHFAGPLIHAAQRGSFRLLRRVAARNFDLAATGWQGLPPLCATLFNLYREHHTDGEPARAHLACFDFLLDIRGTSGVRGPGCLFCENRAVLGRQIFRYRRAVRSRWHERYRRGAIYACERQGCLTIDFPEPPLSTGPEPADPRSRLCQLVYASRFSAAYVSVCRPPCAPSLRELCILQLVAAAVFPHRNSSDDRPFAPLASLLPILEISAPWHRLPDTVQTELTHALADLSLIAALRRGWMDGTLLPGKVIRGDPQRYAGPRTLSDDSRGVPKREHERGGVAKSKRRRSENL